MANSEVDPSTGQFIDPMFAVVIAAAVAETVVAWVKAPILPSGFSLSVVVLGYVNLLLSWFGYHKSVIKKPIRGSLRFIVTVVLLPLYLLTIIMSKNEFAYTSLVYTAIFFLWSVWEYLKHIEHGEQCTFWRLQFRFFNILVYVATGYACLALYFRSFFLSTWYIQDADVIAVVLIAFAVLSLRIVKSAGKEGTPIAKIKAEIRSLLLGEGTK